MEGPDQILQTTTVRTWEAEGTTRINNMGTDKESTRTPISVPSLLISAAARAPEHLAMAVKRNGKDGGWTKWTYKQYLQDVRTAAKGMISLGLERYHSVCILGFNSPEWFISYLSAIFAGGFAAGIYTTNLPEACAYCAIDSKANIFVVEDDAQLEKILKVRDELPHLKAIIQYTGVVREEQGVYSWETLMKLGEKESDDALEDRLKRIAINQCCTLIYTSGTTGTPKGVMLSHDNLTWMSYADTDYVDFREQEEIMISYLPLSHVAAQGADIFCNLNKAGSVYFADKSALKGSLIHYLKEVQPTAFFAVPRVWEKMYEAMMEIGRKTTGVKRSIATWAKGRGLEINLRRISGEENPDTCGFKVANRLVLMKIREGLGLARCKICLSGGAPISPEILKYFLSLNIFVNEIYGMSESSGPNNLILCTAYKLGSVGRTIYGAKTKITDPDADGNGEILMGGRHVCMGYLGQEEQTKATVDEEGWLHSGDIGKVDPQGYLFITGRIKELLITAGGENVAPVPIEDNIKFALPFLSQAMVVGDKVKFLSVLLTLQTKVDLDSQEPLEELSPVTKDWMEQHGNCTVNTVKDVLQELYEKKNKVLTMSIQAGIDAANKHAVSAAQKVQKWVVLPKDFSVPGGELTPTLKMKRQVIFKQYQSTIDGIYE